MPLHRFLVAKFLLAAVPGAMLLGAPASAGPRAPVEENKADHTIGAFFIGYMPDDLHIHKGETVRFVNTDPVSGPGHSFTQATANGAAPRFDSQVTPFGTSSDVVGISGLPEGEYVFHCKIHAVMRGYLSVDPPLKGEYGKVPPVGQQP
jgi:plastocyanin